MATKKKKPKLLSNCIEGMNQRIADAEAKIQAWYGTHDNVRNEIIELNRKVIEAGRKADNFDDLLLRMNARVVDCEHECKEARLLVDETAPRLSAAITEIERRCVSTEGLLGKMNKRIGAVETWDSGRDTSQADAEKFAADGRAALADKIDREVYSLAKRLNEHISHSRGVLDGMAARFGVLENIDRGDVKETEAAALRRHVKELMVEALELLGAMK